VYEFRCDSSPARRGRGTRRALDGIAKAFSRIPRPPRCFFPPADHLSAISPPTQAAREPALRAKGEEEEQQRGEGRRKGESARERERETRTIGGTTWIRAVITINHRNYALSSAR